MDSFRARSARFDLGKNGQIRFNDQVKHCEIIDVSHSGAQLRVSSEAQIPEHFDLYIDIAKQIFRCALVWRNVDSVGIRFTEIIDK